MNWLYFFGDDRNLFGVFAESLETTVSRSRAAVLFLNIGSNHHVGPHRMTVTFARALASLGFATLRFDIAGLGESQVAQKDEENRLYSKTSIADVKAAMNFLHVHGGFKRFILIGLCSGAYLAFHTAVQDTRVAGQILINPQTFHWREGDSLELAMRRSYKSTRFYRDAFFKKDVWLRALRGEVNMKGTLATLRERFEDRMKAKVKNLITRAQINHSNTDDVTDGFKTITQRGSHSLLIYSAEDGGLDEMEMHLGPAANKMRHESHFHLQIIEDADHTFSSLQSRQQLFHLLSEHLMQNFG